MITKLIPTTEFVRLVQEEVKLRQSKLSEWDVEGCLNWDISGYDQICNYVNFISQTPQLWMFVPCDENGVELEEPEMKEDDFHGVEQFHQLTREYNQTKSKVLFSGWASDGKVGIIQNNQPDTWLRLSGYDTVEEIITEFHLSGYDLELTETAIKQFEL